MRGAVLVAALVFAGGAVGCGDDGSQEPSAAPGDTTAESRGHVDADGTLTAPDGSVVRDWGPEAERKLVVRRLAAIQRNFRAGRLKAACAHISDLALAQFTPGLTEADSPCPAKLRAFLGELVFRGARLVPLRVKWARAYPVVASVYVENPAGKRIRVGFTDVDGSGMKLEVGTSSQPEALLFGRLSGVRRYLER